MNLPAEIQVLQLLASRPEHQRTVSCLARLAGESIADTRAVLETLRGRGSVQREGKRAWRIRT
jgi:DNA-binding IclR family transcriptional regulator